MRLRVGIGAAVLALSHVAFASSALAQAGSTGGTIGKQDKSVSGNEEAPDRPRTTPHSRLPGARVQEKTTDHSCRSIVGTWSSWASSQFGPNDTRFNADGTITHPTSKGRWSCENGQYVHVWAAFGRRGPYRLSADGRQLIKIKDGSVSFSRGGAAP